ncbi:MAG: type I methionyl aminopeptidase [Actinobacteria bacterium]|nr:type I methionyl aminopeptidase [Actinomycetota bacterium]
MKLGPNDRCWCGSGRKYKHCHRLRDEAVKPGVLGPERAVPEEIERPPYVTNGGEPMDRGEPIVKAPEVITAMHKAGLAAGEVLDLVGAAVAPGVTTDELDAVAHAAYVERCGYPSPLGYRGFPKSVCTSVNEVICHGIPDDRALREGDIVNVDVTIYLGGVHGDTNATFAVGEIDERSALLMRVTRECLYRGIDAVRPGAEVRAIGRAIQDHAEGNGFGVVRTFCGHAIGHEFHGGLSIPHYDDPRATLRLEPGMTFTIEPMITMGSWRERIWSDGWTAVTADGLRTAQYEHTVVVTDDGAEVLTPSVTLPATLATSPSR